MESALSSFALHTRHHDECLDNPAQRTLMARKYLAVHMPATPSVYMHVADDYALNELRTHNPPLHAYSDGSVSVDAKAFVGILQNGIKKVIEPTKPLASYDCFIESVFPEIDSKEEWVRYHYAKEHEWIKPACFLATVCCSNDKAAFHEVVSEIIKAVHPQEDPNNKERVQKLFSALSNHGNKILLNVDPTEVATLINEVDLSEYKPTQLRVMTDEARRILEERTDEEKEFIIEEVDAPMILSLPIAAEGGIELVRAHPLIQSYRKSAGLNATFSPAKLLKQVICASLRAPTHLVQPILGLLQTELGSLTSAPTADLLQHIVVPVDNLALKTLYHTLKRDDLSGCQLLSEYIGMYNGTSTLPAHVQRAYLARYKEPSVELIEAIIKQ